MQTIEIPREQWPTAVTSIGERHRRSLVSLDILGPEVGAQPEVRSMPLEGISAEPPNKGGTVSIFVERSLDDHLTHLIEKPTRIRVERTDEGEDVAMQIEAADGTSTIVTFLSPANG